MNRQEAKDLLFNALTGYVEDSAGADSEEAKQIQQAWEKLKEKPELTIRVHLSESDLQDLQNFEEFDWSFPTQEDEDQQVKYRIISRRRGRIALFFFACNFLNSCRYNIGQNKRQNYEQNLF